MAMVESAAQKWSPPKLFSTTSAICGVQGREHRAPGLFFMIENSPLSGEFQKGEAYSCQKEALLCYKKVVLTSVVAKESDNG